jgi:methionyl-tRNA formyltransferase
MTSSVILLTDFDGANLGRLRKVFEVIGSNVIVVRDLEGLRGQAVANETTLVSFGTGVVVPKALIDSLGQRAYNVHAASPEFPGRDPHHFAIYQGAKRYGATLHVMTDQVDAGPIIAIEMSDVPLDCRPSQLLHLANEAGFRLIETYAGAIISGHILPVLDGIAWGPITRRRKDFFEHCRISPEITSTEFLRRYNAFDGETHDNLWVEIQGWTFRIDKSRGRRK